MHAHSVRGIWAAPAWVFVLVKYECTSNVASEQQQGRVAQVHLTRYPCIWWYCTWGLAADRHVCVLCVLCSAGKAVALPTKMLCELNSRPVAKDVVEYTHRYTHIHRPCRALEGRAAGRGWR